MKKRTIFKVLWSRTAEKDLESIFDYISLDSLARAFTILDRLQEKADLLISFPRRGRIVPELKEHGIHLYRELVAQPWRIIYRITEKQVIVLAVIDGRRNIEDLLLDRIIRQEITEPEES